MYKRQPHGSAGRRHCVETQQPTRLVGGRTGDDDVTAQRREIGFQSLQPLNVAEQHPRLDGIDGRTQPVSYTHLVYKRQGLRRSAYLTVLACTL